MASVSVSVSVSVSETEKSDSAQPLRAQVSHQVALFTKELNGVDAKLQEFWAAQHTTFDHFELQPLQDFFFVGSDSIDDTVQAIKDKFKESDLIQTSFSARKVKATKTGAAFSEFFEYDKGKGITGMGHVFWARLGAKKGCDYCILYIAAECNFQLKGTYTDYFLGTNLPATVQDGITNCMKLQYMLAACDQKLVVQDVMQGVSSRNIGLLRDASFMEHVNDTKVEVVISAPQCMNRFREIYVDLSKRYRQGQFSGHDGCIMISEEVEALKVVWDMWSMPYNGCIGPTELLQVLIAIGQPPMNDGEDLDAIFKEWDLNEDGNISFQEFIKEIEQRVNDGLGVDNCYQ